MVIAQIVMRLDSATLVPISTFVVIDRFCSPVGSGIIQVILAEKEAHSPQEALENLHNHCYTYLPGAVEILEKFMDEKYKYKFAESKKTPVKPEITKERFEQIALIRETYYKNGQPASDELTAEIKKLNITHDEMCDWHKMNDPKKWEELSILRGESSGESSGESK